MTNSKNSFQVTLATLPPEVLAQIVTHIETARALSRLSRTCRRIHDFIEYDGFRVFAQTRFPSAKFPAAHARSFWRDATHGLTTLSRNWERKAFITRKINPVHVANDDGRRHRDRAHNVRRGQTMGFVPIIDSYESWYGDRWTSRKEVVGWGQGADIVVRLKTMGDRDDDWATTQGETPNGRDMHRIENQWFKYHEPGALEGRDDISSLYLLPRQGLDGSEDLIVGRASGGLSCISLSKRDPQGRVNCSYATKGRPVRSATISDDKQTLLAACLSDSTVALYRLCYDTPEEQPIAEISPISAARTWSSRFLNNDRLAIGRGAGKEQIVVYNVGRGELTSENMLTMGFDDTGADSRLDNKSTDNSSTTSIYSMAPIPKSALAGGMEGNLFLSGAYDGLVRLHDIRSPEFTVAIFRDPVDTFSPIYSLLPIGSERFVAGGGRHSIIKIFDLRLPGGKLYYSTDLDPCSTTRDNLPKQKDLKLLAGCCGYHYEAKHSRRDWNVFLDMGHKSQRNRESPVYSLSRPSQCSPTLFACVESTVLQLDMVSIMDQHPDAMSGNRSAAAAKSRSANEYVQDPVQHIWDPEGDALSLSMYEHDEGPVSLLRQDHVGHVDGAVKGWDERWSSHRSWR